MLVAYRDVLLQLAYYLDQNGKIARADHVRRSRIATLGDLDGESIAIDGSAKEIGDHYFAWQRLAI